MQRATRLRLYNSLLASRCSGSHVLTDSSSRYRASFHPNSEIVTMERWEGRVALVTGSSSGIGAAVCRALVGHGMKVVGCARNLEKLQEVEKTVEGPGSFLAVQCDVSREDDVTRLFKVIKDEVKGVDVCINNAGLCHSASLLAGKTDQWADMLNINVLGVSMCTREAIKSMRNRKIDDGHIINISSMSGHRVISSRGGHFYSATKYAVTALTEGVRNELREVKSHIRVSQISPGIVQTEFQERAFGDKAAGRIHGSIKCLQSEDISDAVIYMLSAPPHVQVHDVLIRPTEQVS